MGMKWVQNTAIESWVDEVAEKAENGIAQRHRCCRAVLTVHDVRKLHQAPISISMQLEASGHRVEDITCVDFETSMVG